MKPTVAVFGPTGYIGLILVNHLVKQKVPLLLFARTKKRLDHLRKHPQVTFYETPIEQANTQRLMYQLRGVTTIYYLIHSMGSSDEDFYEKDNELATIVAKAAAEAKVKQIIYLGALGDNKLSQHLESRQRTAQKLGQFNTPVTEFRCSIVIGGGSASFEIIRALGTKLPFIPQLSYNTGVCQPIDIDSVTAYLYHALNNSLYFDQIIEIGCTEKLTYTETVQIFAKEVKSRNLHVLPVPFIEKFLPYQQISKIITFLTSLPLSLVKPLIEGLQSDAVISEYPIEKVDPNCPVKMRSYKDAVLRASRQEEEGRVEAFWAVPYQHEVIHLDKGESFFKYSGHESEGILYEERIREIPEALFEAVFAEVKKVGGSRGYWSPMWMWQIRGFIDSMLLGPGLSSGRRTFKQEMRIGDRIDFWTVTGYVDEENEKVLRLQARMRSPGKSWLQFSLQKPKNRSGVAIFTLRAYFEPSGIWGYTYWYSLYFIHKYIFTKMINTIIANVKKKLEKG